jgi:hypothetical protein
MFNEINLATLSQEVSSLQTLCFNAVLSASPEMCQLPLPTSFRDAFENFIASIV